MTAQTSLNAVAETKKAGMDKMTKLMTHREEYMNNLAFIREFDGDYYRQISFKEADTWIETFEAYKDEGYPTELAVQYAWDHLFVDRRSTV